VDRTHHPWPHRLAHQLWSRIVVSQDKESVPIVPKRFVWFDPVRNARQQELSDKVSEAFVTAGMQVEYFERVQHVR
jgi:hypothetical protein